VKRDFRGRKIGIFKKEVGMRRDDLGGKLMRDRNSDEESEKARNGFEDRNRGKELAELEERYRILAEQAEVGVAIIQDRLFKYVNPFLAEISGYKEEELMDSPFGIYIHPDELPKVVNFYMRRMAGEDVPSRYESVVKTSMGQDVEVEFNSHRITYQRKPAVLVIVRNITEAKRTEKNRSALHKISRAVLEAGDLKELFGSIHHLVSELMPADDNFYIALYDQAADRISYPYFVDKHMENPGPHSPGRGLSEYVLWRGEPLLALPEKIAELEREGKIESSGLPAFSWLGVPLKTKEQTLGVMAVRDYRASTGYGEEDLRILELISSHVALSVECQQHKSRWKEMEQTMRRVHHRVKNNMQLILSLLRLQSNQIKDEDTLHALEAVQGRVRSLSLIHESLYQSQGLEEVDFSDYLTRMTSQLLIEFKDMEDMIRLNLDVGRITLDVERAVSCGLIVHELLYNALRHAFPGGRRGEILVRMDEDKAGKRTLIVKDSGVGFPKGLNYCKTETLGMQLVNDGVKQLKGTIRLRRAKGTEFRIIF
jgi:PAS domain S-box-containing protein